MVCSIEGCQRGDRIKRDLCHKHYEYWRRHGNPVPPPLQRQHGTYAGYWQHWRRREAICEACNIAINEYHAAKRKENPERFRARAKLKGYSRRRYEQHGETVREQIRESSLKLQSVTTNANRNGYEWTGPELEALLTSHLSNVELAKLLGRTYYATCRKRNQLRREQEHNLQTRLVRLAGVAKQPGTGVQVRKLVSQKASNA